MAELKKAIDSSDNVKGYEKVSSNSVSQLSKLMDIKGEVLEALKNGKPVVALESTIISHGKYIERE